MSHRLQYTEMNIGHYAEAFALWGQAEGTAHTIGDSKEEIAAYLQRNPGFSFVCTEKGKVIGTILCGHDGRRGFIYHLAVDKEFRGMKIGKTLVEMSLDKLRAAGLDRCIIMVKDFNDAGNEFWSKTGWHIRKELTMYSLDL